MLKLHEIAANYAYETTHYNLTGKSMNPVIPFVHQSTHLKKLREFFLKNVTFRSFLSGMKKPAERQLMVLLKCQGFSPGDRVIRNNTRDRGLFFVVSGQFFGLDDTFP